MVPWEWEFSLAINKRTSSRRTTPLQHLESTGAVLNLYAESGVPGTVSRQFSLVGGGFQLETQMAILPSSFSTTCLWGVHIYPRYLLIYLSLPPLTNETEKSGNLLWIFLRSSFSFTHPSIHPSTTLAFTSSSIKAAPTNHITMRPHLPSLLTSLRPHRRRCSQSSSSSPSSATSTSSRLYGIFPPPDIHNLHSAYEDDDDDDEVEQMLLEPRPVTPGGRGRGLFEVLDGRF
ncbi:hypothetical protein K440DRAFT_621935 [Wilcoxina mikolae CBS 423.85]|nr:hypothetical protein K440DRAFT_621935 [Wilcoxina mikolae CBS 423.85]